MSCIKSWDGFAKPVHFTYKGEDEFKTLCGGFAGIITTLLIAIYGVQQVLFLWLKPDYSETVQTSFADFNTNTERIYLDTQYTTIAA